VLDAGEASVISLSRQLKPDAVLIDEQKARRIARNVYNLPVIGTVSVLLSAKSAGVLERLEPVLNQMRQHGYWIADAIVKEALIRAGEL
jgi:predicted nucleic acid-binding protein